MFLGLLHYRVVELGGLRDGTPVKTDSCNTSGTQITWAAWRPRLSHTIILPG